MKKEKKRNWKKYIVGLWALFILGALQGLHFCLY
jgi:hypothetical protein